MIITVQIFIHAKVSHMAGPNKKWRCQQILFLIQILYVGCLGQTKNSAYTINMNSMKAADSSTYSITNLANKKFDAGDRITWLVSTFFRLFLIDCFFSI